MIRYGLACEKGHESEGWFRSATDFDTQVKCGLVQCVICGSRRVGKALMAPFVATADDDPTIPNAPVLPPAPPSPREAYSRFVEHVASVTEDVGDRFCHEAREIHYGSAPPRPIRGCATPEEARALLEEGIEIAPLPPAPDDLN